MRKSSEKIDEIVQVIAEVADETKLLALNAAILSAQAGEHGKGFSVAADEIGRLAERTAQNTKEITTIIEEVKGYINNVATAEEKTVSLIGKGLELITDAGVVFNGILETPTASASQTAFIEKATAEQAKTMEDMKAGSIARTKRIEAITDIAKDNLGLAKEMTKESSVLGDAVGTLDGEINRFRS